MSTIPERARAHRIEQCKVAALTAIGLLGPAHALLADGTGATVVIVSLLLTAAQAFAIFSIISAVFVIRELKKDTDLDAVVVRIPIACCSAAGALLVIATCVVHWTAACGIAVLATVFIIVIHRGTVIAFGKRLVDDCVSALGRHRAPHTGEGASTWAPLLTMLAEPANGADVEPALDV